MVVRMHPFKVTNIESFKIRSRTDVLLYTVGYESRSRHIVENYEFAKENVLAIVYGSNQTHSFSKNYEFMNARRFRQCEAESKELQTEISEFIQNRQRDSGSLSISVDVSSMDRSIMAAVLLSAVEQMRALDSLSILYTPSQFLQPKLELYPIKAIGAAHPGISGGVADPTRATSLILGIGYEYGISLSILDMHEPDVSFIFRPIGFDDRFLQSVSEANFGFDFGERNYEIIDYRLDSAAALYDSLSSLVVSMKHNTAIICVPFGPKLFSAVCIIVARNHAPDISVLRYSTSFIAPESDVTPLCKVVGVTFERAHHRTDGSFAAVI
jgi:hypothetical protein